MFLIDVAKEISLHRQSRNKTFRRQNVLSARFDRNEIP